MDELDKLQLKILKDNSKRFHGGEQVELYLKKCKSCKVYRQLLVNPPIGPGGTLGCPMCKINKKDPHLEGCYGYISVEKVYVTLADDI